MRAITICQPYAELILRGDKKVENRKWPTTYRGPLLIHAGKSQEWLELDDSGTFDESYNIPLASMQFGAILGVVQIQGCIHGPAMCRPCRDFDPWVLEAWPWLANHEHAEGPYCWILEDAYRFSTPIAFRGHLGLFDVPAGLVAVGLSEANRTGYEKPMNQVMRQTTERVACYGIV